MDCRAVSGGIEKFIQQRVSEAGATGAVLGISGGVDSSLTALLCSQALGREKVLALVMPEKGEGAGGKEVARLLGIDYEVIDIAGIVDAAKGACGHNADAVALGNIKARARMMLLYYHANALKRLVAGTGNRSELLMGYFTKYGDGACDFLPVGGLYKTQVRELARFLKLPEKIITNVPTAGLWPGQTDEGELGIDYGTLDRILELFGKNKNVAQVVEELQMPQEKVMSVWMRVRKNAHKLQLPPTCQI